MTGVQTCALPICNAIDYANAQNRQRFATFGYLWFENQTFQDDDTLIWGDDPGNFTGIYGHIAKWTSGKIVNQNNNGREYVTLDNFFPQGFLGYYRKVNNMEYITEAYLDVMANVFFLNRKGKGATDEEKLRYVGKADMQRVSDDFLQSNEHQQVVATYNAASSKFVPVTQQLFEEVQQ